MSAPGRLLGITLLCVLVIPVYASGIEPLVFDNPDQELRYRALLKELRCLKCQNQNLADSPSEVAGDLRKEILRQMQTGASNREIGNFLVARYGDFVLYQPRLKPTTYLLWFGPLLLFIGGIFAVRAIASNYAQRKAEPPLSADEQARLRDLMKDPGGGKPE